MIQFVGLLAPVLFLYAYAMVSLNRWNANMLRFHVLNFLGAGLILVTLAQQWNLPVCILECSWATISIYGMGKALLSLSRAKRGDPSL